MATTTKKRITLSGFVLQCLSLVIVIVLGLVYSFFVSLTTQFTMIHTTFI